MIKARLFDKQSSDFADVNLEFTDDELIIYGADTTYAYYLEDISFSARLGDMPRSIYFPDSKVCETQDNKAIDTQLKKRSQAKSSRFIHHLESKSIYILPALAITIFIVFIFLKYGLPYSAQKISYAIPQGIASKVGTGTLQALDKLVLEPTKLDIKDQNRIQTAMLTLKKHVKDLPPLDLQFRSAPKIGPNAFALPNGTIVVTDQLVKLSDNDNELLSILAHEIGHIKNRHALRIVLQNSAMLVIVTTLTGDATAASSLLSALPTVMIESSYSRDIENEADDFAMQLMLKADIQLHYFADIMQKLSSQIGEEDELGEYFSTHPITSTRISKFQQ